MGELWNLDQALIWIASGDGQKVLWAEGDAWGDQIRQLGYADFLAEATESDRMIGGIFPDGDEEDECDVTAVLIRHLRKGNVKAYRADSGSQIEIIVLNRCTCAPSELCVKRDKNGIVMTLLEAPRSPSPEDAAGQKSLPALFCVSDLKALFPPKAPAEMQAELSRLIGAEDGLQVRPTAIVELPAANIAKPTRPLPSKRGAKKRSKAIAIETYVREKYGERAERFGVAGDGNDLHAKNVYAVRRDVGERLGQPVDIKAVTRAVDNLRKTRP